MGEVLAVEEVGRKLLQTAAGQIYRVDSLGHHLDGGGVESENSREVTGKEKHGVRQDYLLHTTLLLVYSVCVCVCVACC